MFFVSKWICLIFNLFSSKQWSTTQDTMKTQPKQSPSLVSVSSHSKSVFFSVNENILLFHQKKITNLRGLKCAYFHNTTKNFFFYFSLTNNNALWGASHNPFLSLYIYNAFVYYNEATPYWIICFYYMHTHLTWQNFVNARINSRSYALKICVHSQLVFTSHLHSFADLVYGKRQIGLCIR